MNQEQRIFAAIPLSKDFTDDLKRHLNHFDNLPVGFIPAANWHLTLAFFGYLNEAEISALKNIIDSSLKDRTTFSLKSKKIMFAPPNKPSRMLWLNFELSKEYNDLAFSIEKEILTLKKEKKTFLRFKPPYRPLKIHLTLSRFKPQETLRIKKVFSKLNLGKFEAFEKELPVDKIQIMKSRLSPEGTEYEIIARYHLLKT